MKFLFPIHFQVNRDNPVRPVAKTTGPRYINDTYKVCSNLIYKTPKIQFSSTVSLFGGAGRLRMSNLASREKLLMVSLRRTAMCMRLTLRLFLCKQASDVLCKAAFTLRESTRSVNAT